MAAKKEIAKRRNRAVERLIDGLQALGVTLNLPNHKDAVTKDIAAMEAIAEALAELNKPMTIKVPPVEVDGTVVNITATVSPRGKVSVKTVNGKAPGEDDKKAGEQKPPASDPADKKAAGKKTASEG